MDKSDEHQSVYPKITENMWCYNCEHEWETDDYFNCGRCPNCDIKPVYIFRTSSTAFVYAWLNKHPDKKPFKK